MMCTHLSCTNLSAGESHLLLEQSHPTLCCQLCLCSWLRIWTVVLHAEVYCSRCYCEQSSELTPPCLNPPADLQGGLVWPDDTELTLADHVAEFANAVWPCIAHMMAVHMSRPGARRRPLRDVREQVLALEHGYCSCNLCLVVQCM